MGKYRTVDMKPITLRIWRGELKPITLLMRSFEWQLTSVVSEYLDWVKVTYIYYG